MSETLSGRVAELGYTLPDPYVTVTQALAVSGPAPSEQVAKPEPPVPDTAADALLASDEEPLWQRIWKMNTISIAITVVALLILTAIFFFQDWLVRRPVLFGWIRRSYLVFTLVWLGWYANAQLSVVNVLTFTNALVSDFSWEFFLSAPLIFILWAAVAVGLLFWGRWTFCGLLCPFGALQ